MDQTWAKRFGKEVHRLACTWKLPLHPGHVCKWSQLEHEWLSVHHTCPKAQDSTRYIDMWAIEFFFRFVGDSSANLWLIYVCFISCQLVIRYLKIKDRDSSPLCSQKRSHNSMRFTSLLLSPLNPLLFIFRRIKIWKNETKWSEGKKKKGVRTMMRRSGKKKKRLLPPHSSPSRLCFFSSFNRSSLSLRPRVVDTKRCWRAKKHRGLSAAWAV